MAREFSKHIYASATWKHRIADRSNPSSYWHYPRRLADGRIVPDGMCERCFEQGYLVPAEIIHHKVWLTPENVGDPAVTYGYDNLQRVCRDCHARIHAGDSMPRRYSFDEDGNLVWRGDPYV